jgi:hypothetical protein
MFLLLNAPGSLRQSHIFSLFELKCREKNFDSVPSPLANPQFYTVRKRLKTDLLDRTVTPSNRIYKATKGGGGEGKLTLYCDLALPRFLEVQKLSGIVHITKLCMWLTDATCPENLKIVVLGR